MAVPTVANVDCLAAKLLDMTVSFGIKGIVTVASSKLARI
jgi:hypothetical protein